MTLVLTVVSNSLLFARSSYGAQIRWTHEVSAELRGSAVYEGILYVGRDDGSLLALRTDDGSQVWETNLGAEVFSTPVADSNRVYIGAFVRGAPSVLHAAAAQTGARLWKFESAGSQMRHPSADAGRVAFCDGPLLVVLDGVSGQRLWEYEHAPGPLRSALVRDDAVVVQGENGRVVAFDAGSGARRWIVALKNRSRSDPIIHNDVVFVGTLSGEITAIQLASGAVLWKTRCKGGLEGPGAGVGDVVVFCDRTAFVYGLDVHNGEIKWTRGFDYREENTTQFWGLVAVRSSVAFSARHQGIFVLDAASGKELSHHPASARLSLLSADESTIYVSPMGFGNLQAIAVE